MRILLAAALLTTAGATAATTYGPQLEGFSYPHPLQKYRFASQGRNRVVQAGALPVHLPATGGQYQRPAEAYRSGWKTGRRWACRRKASTSGMRVS